MTLRELIYGFKDFAADVTHRVSDDSGWSNRLIKHYFDVARSELIWQKRVQRPNFINRHNEQTLPCIKMKRIDVNECPCLPASGCMFLKSDNPIPSPVGDFILSVTSVTGNIRFDYLKWSNFSNKLESRIPAERTARYYTIKDIGEGPHIYVYNDEIIDSISLTAIFDDPIEVMNYPSCGETKKPICSPLDEEYVIDKDLIMPMYRSVLQTIGTVKRLALGGDNNNNDQSDASGVQIPRI